MIKSSETLSYLLIDICIVTCSRQVGICIVTRDYYTPGIHLYPRHLCRRVYSFRLSVCPFVSSFVRSYFRHVRGICIKVLRQSFSCGVYLSNYSSESIHIWTIVTLEGWHSLHDLGPQGPCPGVGPEVKIWDTLKSVFSRFCYGFLEVYILGTTHQKAFILEP